MSLSTSVGRLALENPTILASGIWGETGRSLLRAFEGGAAAVVTKSIGLEPREGYPNPTVVELEGGCLNAMGLPNPGIDLYAEELGPALKAGRPVIGSIFGRDREEFVALAVKMESYGVSALELNLSCPHAKGYGAEIGTDPEAVREIVGAVKAGCSIPVLAKLTPNVADIGGIARAVEKGGGDGIVAVNTLRAMAIEPELGRPVLSNRFGGLSGRAIKPVGVRCVYEVFEQVKIPVIGCGGIESGADALEYLMAGARAVQIGSALRSRGADVFKEVCAELETFMSRQGYRSIEEMVGIAHGP